MGDLAVGAPQDDAGPFANSGALWLLFLSADGSVASLAGELAGGDELGTACASLGDLNGDGVAELVARARGHDLHGRS